MRMFNPLAVWAPIISCRCRSQSATVGGLGTLWYMVTNVNWTAVCVEMDGAHVICASMLALERLRAAGVGAW